MKKLLTLILLATTFMFVTINTHASGTLITLTPESGTIGTTSVSYNFDGTYITLNGSYSGYHYLRILDNNVTVINDNFYDIHITYISGTYTFDGLEGTINFGYAQYFRKNPLPQAGESYTHIADASTTGTGGRLVIGDSATNTGSGTFTNYVIKVEYFEIPSVVEHTVYYFHGETQKTTQQTAYLETVKPSSTFETLDGHIFKGWYEDPSFTFPHTFGTAISADLNLYAKFVPETNIAQDLTITPVTNSATANFHLREENSKAYLVNTATLLNIDYTLLSQASEGASTISVSSEKTFYNVMVFEYEGFVEKVYTLPTTPETEDITIWYDLTDSKIRFNHSNGQHAIPINLGFTVYFTNFDTFLQTHNKITYLYDGGSMVKYLKLDEQPLSVNLGNGNNSINVWYTDPQFTTLYDFNQVPTGDVTVYGQWIDNTTGEPIDNQTPGDDPTNPGDDNNTGDPTNPTDPVVDQETSAILNFLQTYWFPLLLLTLMIALLSPTKK